MPKNSSDLSTQQYEQMLHEYLRFHAPVCLFPILESKENLWYFIGHTSRLVAAKVIEEESKDTEKGRPDAAFLRGLSWLDKLTWNELWLYPDDLLESRTARLVGIISHTPTLPRKAKDAQDPRRVAIEYSLLSEKLHGIIPRRPRRVNIRRTPEYHEATFGSQKGTFFRLLAMKDEQKFADWVSKTLSQAQREIYIPWWTKARTIDLEGRDILESTPREAALKILGQLMQVGNDMVWALVKEGRRLLTSEAIEKLDLAYHHRQHDPAACEFIRCPHLSYDNGQGGSPAKKPLQNQ